MKDMQVCTDRCQSLSVMGALLLLCILCSPASGSGQQHVADTFYVTAGQKTPAHPYYGEGSDRGYLINGVEGGTVILVRDSLYVFNTSDVPHDLVMQFYSQPIGGTKDTYEDHVVDINFGDIETWIIQAKKQTPDTLYYASFHEPWVGGMILVVDSLTTTSVQEKTSEKKRALSGTITAFPNPFSGETTLSFDMPVSGSVQIAVLNVLGEQVASWTTGPLSSGWNVLSLSSAGLAPGTYLVRLMIPDPRQPSIFHTKVQVVE